MSEVDSAAGAEPDAGLDLPGATADGRARAAALVALRAAARTPASRVSYRSAGTVLVIGPEPYALAQAETLTGRLECTVLAIGTGVYVDGANGSSTRFRWVKAPTSAELGQLTHTIAHRVGRFLERQGLLERDAENSYLAGEAEDAEPLAQLLGHSITYRIAVGPQQGRKVFTLQTLPGCDEPFDDSVGKVAGFSLHAGVAARADERKKLERLCRYIARPAVSEKRLSLLSNGNVRYQLNTPYRDRTTHVIFEPLDFIARLVALVPKSRVNLTRFHGVFAPDSAHRARVTPAKRGPGNKASASHTPDDTTPAERRAAMSLEHSA